MISTGRGEIRPYEINGEEIGLHRTTGVGNRLYEISGEG